LWVKDEVIFVFIAKSHLMLCVFARRLVLVFYNVGGVIRCAKEGM
jgi:hypothetical protein